MLALREYQSLVCGGCGGFLPETTSPDAGYKAELPHRCHRCSAIKSKQREYSDQKNSDALVLWPVTKTS
ncbi:hypothetical protein DMH01_03285 [Amycolatopsis sp. WAC 04182]|nr:hypothetical protein DMH01_03285 [Amycolatopsis sp. WAC 04182]